MYAMPPSAYACCDSLGARGVLANQCFCLPIQVMKYETCRHPAIFLLK